MAGADGIAAHFLEHLQLALQCAIIQSRAEGSQIMMITDAVQKDVLSVDKKSPLGSNLNVRIPNGVSYVSKIFSPWEWSSRQRSDWAVLWRRSPEFWMSDRCAALSTVAHLPLEFALLRAQFRRRLFPSAGRLRPGGESASKRALPRVCCELLSTVTFRSMVAAADETSGVVI